jgi:hypothetical protein
VKRIRWATFTLEAVVGTVNVALGGWIAYHSFG